MKMQFEKYSWDPWKGFDFSQPARQAYKAPQEKSESGLKAWYNRRIEQYIKSKVVAERQRDLIKEGKLTPEQRGRLESYKESSQKIKDWSAEREKLQNDLEHPANWAKKEEIQKTISSYDNAIQKQKDIQVQVVKEIRNSGNKTLKQLAGEAATAANRYDFEAKFQKMEAKELKEAAAKMEKDAGGKPLSKEDQAKKDAMEKTAADKEKATEAKADKGAKNERKAQIDKRLKELDKVEPKNKQEEKEKAREIKALKKEKKELKKEKNEAKTAVEKHDEKSVDVNDRQKVAHERSASLEKAIERRESLGKSYGHTNAAGKSSEVRTALEKAVQRRESQGREYGNNSQAASQAQTALDRAVSRRDAQNMSPGSKAVGSQVEPEAKDIKEAQTQATSPKADRREEDTALKRAVARRDALGKASGPSAQTGVPEKGERMGATVKQGDPAPTGKSAETERSKVASNGPTIAPNSAANRYGASIDKGAISPAQPKAVATRNSPRNSSLAGKRYSASVGKQAPNSNLKPFRAGAGNSQENSEKPNGGQNGGQGQK